MNYSVDEKIGVWYSEVTNSGLECYIERKKVNYMVNWNHFHRLVDVLFEEYGYQKYDNIGKWMIALSVDNDIIKSEAKPSSIIEAIYKWHQS